MPRCGPQLAETTGMARVTWLWLVLLIACGNGDRSTTEDSMRPDSGVPGDGAVDGLGDAATPDGMGNLTVCEEAKLHSDFAWIQANVLTPEREASAAETVRRLERLVAALPRKCREAFVLNRIEGMDFAEVAQVMHLSERMVRTYVMRAVLHCRARVDFEEGNDDLA